MFKQIRTSLVGAFGFLLIAPKRLLAQNADETPAPATPGGDDLAGTEETEEPLVTLPEQPSDCDSLGFLDGISCFIAQPSFAGEALLAVGAGLIVFVVQLVFTSKYFVPNARRDAQRKYANLLRQPLDLPSQQIRSSTIVAGVGGVGKTKLLNRLCANDDANSARSDDKFTTYATSWETRAGMQNFIVRLFAADYAGQDFGTLVDGIIREQVQPESAFRVGHITSLILVVDLFPPTQEHHTQHSSETSHVQERVDYALSEWSDTALDALFALATGKELGFVCLFINKSDILQAVDEAALITLYQDLLDKLRIRGRGAVVRPIVGSAETGRGLVDLREALQKSAVPHIS